MPRGRPKKRPQNISGLHGQARDAILGETADESRAMNSSAQPGHDSEANGDPTIAIDGLKIDFKDLYVDLDGADMSDLDMDEEIELGILQDEELGRKLAEMVKREDGHDPDWIPDRLRRQQQRQAAEKKREY